MPTGMSRWQWTAERLILLCGSLASATALLFMLYLNAKFEGHHMERQAQYVAIARQMATQEAVSSASQVAITELRVATAGLAAELNAMRRDVHRIENGKDNR